MKALKKKKKLYQHGGETDPPKKKSKTAKVMGLPGQQVYTEAVPKRHQDFSDLSKYSEQYHHRGDAVAPSYNLHKDSGVVRKGHGQVSRAVDPTKKGKKGSVKGKSIKKYDEGGRLERQLKRKKRKLDKITPQEGSGPAKGAGTTGMMTFDMSGNDGCPPGQKRRTKGSCKKGNLRARKSEPSKGLKREKTKANVAGKGLPQKRKKLTAEIADLEKRLRALKNPGKFTNPRFL